MKLNNMIKKIKGGETSMPELISNHWFYCSSGK